MSLIHSKTPKSLMKCKGDDCEGCPDCKPKLADGGQVQSPDGGQKKPNPIGYPEGASWAKGGEIEAEEVDSDHDQELSHAAGEELMSAIHSKDKKGMMDAIKAIVLQCKG